VPLDRLQLHYASRTLHVDLHVFTIGQAGAAARARPWARRSIMASGRFSG
jgi:hypothetical protein